MKLTKEHLYDAVEQLKGYIDEKKISKFTVENIEYGTDLNDYQETGFYQFIPSDDTATVMQPFINAQRIPITIKDDSFWDGSGIETQVKGVTGFQLRGSRVGQYNFTILDSIMYCIKVGDNYYCSIDVTEDFIERARKYSISRNVNEYTTYLRKRYGDSETTLTLYYLSYPNTNLLNGGYIKIYENSSGIAGNNTLEFIFGNNKNFENAYFSYCPTSYYSSAHIFSSNVSIINLGQTFNVFYGEYNESTNEIEWSTLGDNGKFCFMTSGGEQTVANKPTLYPFFMEVGKSSDTYQIVYDNVGNTYTRYLDNGIWSEWKGKTIELETELKDINKKIEENKIIVDSALSETSENPVQNKVITKKFEDYYNITEIDNKQGKFSVENIPNNSDLNNYKDLGFYSSYLFISDQASGDSAVDISHNDYRVNVAINTNYSYAGYNHWGGFGNLVINNKPDDVKVCLLYFNFEDYNSICCFMYSETTESITWSNYGGHSLSMSDFTVQSLNSMGNDYSETRTRNYDFNMTIDNKNYNVWYYDIMGWNTGAANELHGLYNRDLINIGSKFDEIYFYRLNSNAISDDIILNTVKLCIKGEVPNTNDYFLLQNSKLVSTILNSPTKYPFFLTIGKSNNKAYQIIYSYDNKIYTRQEETNGWLNWKEINGGFEIIVDSALSETSTNPVQNKVITEKLNEVFQSVSNGKTLIASAITDKGVNTEATDTFETMANNIGMIESGTGSGSRINCECVVASNNRRNLSTLANAEITS